MLFAIGTKVRLIHTNDIGVVEEWMEHGLIGVRLSDGEVIPVDKDSIVRIADEAPSKVKAKFVPGKLKPEPLPLQALPANSQYTVLKPQGLQLAFDPVLRADDMPDFYRIFLVNDTQHHFLYQLSLLLEKKSVWSTQGRLGPRTMIEAGSLRYTELNASPQVNTEAWRLLPDGKGTGQSLKRELKLKPTQFFKKLTTAPYLNRSVYLYHLFTDKELAQKKEQPKEAIARENLRTYTQRTNTKPKRHGWSNLQNMPHEVWDLATFKNEIDLHIENLTDHPEKIQKGQILSTQLRHFEEYMDRAIRLGAERVFIIHGLGEGKLRDAVAKRLSAMPEVKSFVNDFHPLYGYGATEVVL
jgi:hypothetical protein